MANIEELSRKVLDGLMHCSMEPDFDEDCWDCPYRDRDDDFCISRLCRDAYSVITRQDMLIGQMGRGGVVIDANAKPVEALRYCVGHRECYGADHECPYHESEDCLHDMQAGLLAMIDGGDAP